MAELDRLFDTLVEHGGSDLHLRVGRPPLIRADGDMRRLDGEPELSNENLQSLLSEIMKPRNKEEFDEVHDTDFSYEIPGKMRLRCNVGMDRFGMTAVFRIIPFEVIPFDKLGLPRAAWDLCMLSKGLVVVTGPTGSGKSTTTAASTMDRIIDSFPEGRQNQIRAMLANSLKGVIAQVLLKRIGGGRVAGLEILIVDRGISSMIRDGKIHQIPSAMQVGGALGMITLNDSLCNLVAAGTVDSDECYIKAVDKDDLVTKLNGKGLPLPTHMEQQPAEAAQ